MRLFFFFLYCSFLWVPKSFHFNRVSSLFAHHRSNNLFLLPPFEPFLFKQKLVLVHTFIKLVYEKLLFKALHHSLLLFRWNLVIEHLPLDLSFLPFFIYLFLNKRQVYIVLDSGDSSPCWNAFLGHIALQSIFPYKLLAVVNRSSQVARSPPIFSRPTHHNCHICMSLWKTLRWQYFPKSWSNFFLVQLLKRRFSFLHKSTDWVFGYRLCLNEQLDLIADIRSVFLSVKFE